jgi:hypothetical protein
MKFAICALSATLGLMGVSGPAAAQPAGEWTRCVAWNNGQTYNIVNGSVSAARCFELARRATGNPNVRATYYTPPVIVNAPYIRSTIN